jgi:hypothetical protein
VEESNRGACFFQRHAAGEDVMPPFVLNRLMEQSWQAVWHVRSDKRVILHNPKSRYLWDELIVRPVCLSNDSAIFGCHSSQDKSRKQREIWMRERSQLRSMQSKITMLNEKPGKVLPGRKFKIVQIDSSSVLEGEPALVNTTE